MRIVAADAAPDPAPRVFGRREEIQLLLTALARRPTDPGVVVLVTGDAGIGKSALIATALKRARASSRLVLAAAAEPMDQRRPYGILLEVLSSGPRPIAEAAGAIKAQQGVGRLEGDGVVGMPVGAPEFIVDEQILTLIDQLAASPFTLVLEDLHWADPASLALLGRLSRTLAQLPVVVIVSVRSGAQSDALGHLLSALSTRGLLLRVDLQPLSADVCAAITEELTGARVEQDLAAYIGAAGGNPFYLTEIVKALLREVSFSVRPDGSAHFHRPVPPSPSLTTIILGQLDFLAPRTRELLSLAALLGTRFRLRDFGVLADQSITSLLPALREAVDAGFLESVDEATMSFRHAIIQEILVNDLPLAVRGELHRTAAERLEQSGASPVAVAEHLLLTPTMAETVPWQLRVADETVSTSPETAVALWRKVLQDTRIAAGLRARATSGLSVAALITGHVREAEQLARAALELGPSPDLAAVLTETLAKAQIYRGDVVGAVTSAEAAAGNTELEPGARARHLVVAAWARFYGGDPSRAEVGGQAALRLAEDSGNVPAQVGSLTLLGHIDDCRGDLATAERLLLRAVRLTSHEWSESMPHQQAAIALGDADRYDEAFALVEQGRQLSESRGFAAGVLTAFATAAHLRCLSGHLADVDADLDTRDAIFGSTDVRLEPAVAGIRAFVAFHQGGPDAAQRWLQHLRNYQGRSLEIGRGRAGFFAAQGAYLSALGNQRGALEILRKGWDECIAKEAFIECADLGVDLVQLALTAGDHESADMVLPVLDDLARRNPSVTHLAGTAASVAGLIAGDCDQLAEGARLLGTTPRLLAYAGTAQLAAEALAGAGRKAEGGLLAESVLRAYAEVGANHDVAVAGARFRRLGLVRRGRSPAPRATTGWESLTRTEERVARHVATGMSNPEVAEVLFQSRRTVETHVSHILAKLGLRSRTELVLLVARRAGELGDGSRP